MSERIRQFERQLDDRYPKLVPSKTNLTEDDVRKLFWSMHLSKKQQRIDQNKEEQERMLHIGRLRAETKPLMSYDEFKHAVLRSEEIFDILHGRLSQTQFSDTQGHADLVEEQHQLSWIIANLAYKARETYKGEDT